MRILMVCPYPPVRDGIGAYAVQQAMTLRSQGHRVEILSPLPSAAHHHLELRGWRGPLALAKRTHKYDRVIVHFHVDMFYPAPLRRAEWVAITTGLIAAFSAARSLDLIIHEINYSWGRRASVRQLARTMLRSATRVLVHTPTEKRMLCEAFALPSDSVHLIEHGSDFIRRSNAEPAVARRVLGVPDEAFVFLAIGFVQPHKGFDRAIVAFDELGAHGCRLYIVGSIRVEEPEYLAHLEDLRALAAERPGVELRIDYVSDDHFDAWLVAADVVVLPYRYIWSSSVLERARLYSRPVIAADVGGLRDQGYPGVRWVTTDEDLRVAMHEAAGHPGLTESGGTVHHEPFVVPPGTPREAVMESIRRRAGTQRRPRAGVGTSVAPAAEVAPLLRLSHLSPPPLTSRSRSHRVAKQLLNRLMRWQTEPLRLQVNALRDATLQVAESLAAQKPDQLEDRADGDGG
jgi:glycosyltransferase involved in cell wall biosynthesis